MSRYPGTQFRVYDNSQVAAIVPIVSSTNNADNSVAYLTAFRSIKGPEIIQNRISGDDFYKLYGDQSTINFKKYGQPLFQASMNINNGATLISKRVVLDDATIANVSLGVCLTKYLGYAAESMDNYDTALKTVSVDSSDVKYSLSPLMFSIDNFVEEYATTTELVDDKDRAQLYKDFVINTVSNIKDTNDIFLHNLNTTDRNVNSVLSGFSVSTYYDGDGKITNQDGNTSTVKEIHNLSAGSIKTKRTVSKNYSVGDVINYTATPTISSISRSDTSIDINTSSSDAMFINGTRIMASVIERTPQYGSDGVTITGYSNWNYISNTVSIEYFGTSENGVSSMDQIMYYDSPDTIISNYATNPAILDNRFGGTDTTNKNAITRVLIVNVPDAENYDNVIHLGNDIMVSAIDLIQVEYIYPLFTIFDNGRGESTKSIKLSFDTNTSKTMNMALYNLAVCNYSTDSVLESFTFSIDPSAKNSSTGYSFDIETAVNFVSTQIQVESYDQNYDYLLDTLQSILETTDTNLIQHNDIIFGYNLDGTYPVYNSYIETKNKKVLRTTYIYDMGRLDTFGNDLITVNAACISDNMSVLDPDNDIMVRYYFYDYNRLKKNIGEQIMFGYDGADYTLILSDNQPPFIIALSESLGDIIKITGNSAASIYDTVLGIPRITNNFAAFNIADYDVVEITVYYADKTNRIGYTIITDEFCNMENTIDYSVEGSNSSDKAIELAQIYGVAYVYNVAQTGASDLNTFNEFYIPYTEDKLYNVKYKEFYDGTYDRSIYNLDVYYPNAIFDANYDNETKLAIQRLAAYRGDFMCYMDCGIDTIYSYEDLEEIIPAEDAGTNLTSETNNGYYYIRSMFVAVTCVSYAIRNPYDNKKIKVTATYGLSNLYINHWLLRQGNVFAGISNSVTFDAALPNTVSYIPKIYPTSSMTSLNNIGGYYPSDDETICNEKQILCDLRVNYCCYYNDVLTMDTEYTMHPDTSEFSYWNNVSLVCAMMQDIRKTCPTARYQFVTSNDLTVYQRAVEQVMSKWKNSFASCTFTYLQDEQALANKIYYAAIEVAFKPFAQAEIFTITALNYSTLSASITSV